jgi:hypothetical protein
VHGSGKFLKIANEFGPDILEYGLPIAGDFIPNTQPQPQQQQPPRMREFDDMELFERDFDELESREPHSSAVAKWIEAAINGGLDFASNAVQASGVGHRRGLE